MTSCDETVAAIIARPTKHDYGTRSPTLFKRVCDGTASIFHQFNDRFAGSHCQPVSFIHTADIK
jgi:hypothetical protein